jgi:uridine phosphorylase
MTLEELIAFGIKKFVNLGTAGGLQQSMNVGDIVICESAIRDEGASHHYLPHEEYAYACPEMTERLRTAFERKGIQYSKEASALFAVGAYRGVSVSSVFVISDLLSEEGWNQGYHSAAKLEGLKQVFDAALATIAVDSKI